MTDREEGFYWVKWRGPPGFDAGAGSWWAAHWTGSRWYLPGLWSHTEPTEFPEIGPRIPRPAR